MTGDVERYLAVAAGLFVLGVIGFVTRRNLILLVLSAELMMHGVGLTFVTFSRMHHTFEGHVMSAFGLTIAACEAALALAMILGLYQITKSLDIELWTDLRELDLPNPRSDESFAVIEPEEDQFPKLTPAGPAPVLPRQRVVINRKSPTGSV